MTGTDESDRERLKGGASSRGSIASGGTSARFFPLFFLLECIDSSSWPNAASESEPESKGLEVGTAVAGVAVGARWAWESSSPDVSSSESSKSFRREVFAMGTGGDGIRPGELRWAGDGERCDVSMEDKESPRRAAVESTLGWDDAGSVDKDDELASLRVVDKGRAWRLCGVAPDLGDARVSVNEVTRSRLAAGVASLVVSSSSDSSTALNRSNQSDFM
jgi:hypothetical protein